MGGIVSMSEISKLKRSSQTRRTDAMGRQRLVVTSKLAFEFLDENICGGILTVKRVRHRVTAPEF